MMHKNKSQQLQESIQLLKLKQSAQLASLKNEVQETIVSLHPINIIKSSIKKVTGNSDAINNVLGLVASIGAAYLSKKLIVGKSKSTGKNILGSLAEFAVMGLISYFNDKDESNQKDSDQTAEETKI